MKTSDTNKITICAMCMALCCVLPTVFGRYTIGPWRLGAILSPIHIPVLLCGLLCGGGYGAVCGFLGPILASLIFQAPPTEALPSMIPEVVVYGFVSGLCLRYIRVGCTVADIYIGMIIAMLAGRAVGIVAHIVIAAATTGVYTVTVWLGDYFVKTLPGIVIQLILIPMLVLALQKARVIPARYIKAVQE